MIAAALLLGLQPLTGSWHVLSGEERKTYDAMKSKFGSNMYRYNRNRKNKVMSLNLCEIKGFVKGDWNRRIARGHACGILWFGTYLTKNCQVLCILLGKSKSSINGSLKTLGYSITHDVHFSEIFPGIASLSTQEQRKWAIYKLPVTENAPMAMNISGITQDPGTVHSTTTSKENAANTNGI
ncbi:MAG: hypothetical protein LBQ03_01485 [Puniceicoccales bacterium]|jgi:hypothetical protein|nr:hypothetical protein [Puniceicoccales bacterium]